MIDESIFKAYDIRGVYPDSLNEDVARGIGRAFVNHLGLSGSRVVVARDMRLSGEALETAFIEGVTEAAVVGRPDDKWGEAVKAVVVLRPGAEVAPEDLAALVKERKGAIHAGKGVRGLIPGSMGAASYVVTGKGNPVSLNSSPHGAGRAHSRTAAKRLFTRKDLDARMDGIAWGHSDAFLDEHPDAYKDIDVVMRDAEDLVEVRHTLRQVVNVKGD